MRLLTLIKAYAIAFIALFLLFLLSGYVKADSMSIEELSVQYKHFLSGGSHPLITENGLSGKTLDKELNLTLNTNIFKYVYFNNFVHSMTDKNVDGSQGQFRLIGWQYAIGAHLSSALDVGYYHFSQHLLDTTYSHGHFPVENAIELKLYLIRPKPNEGLF